MLTYKFIFTQNPNSAHVHGCMIYSMYNTMKRKYGTLLCSIGLCHTNLFVERQIPIKSVIEVNPFLN